MKEKVVIRRATEEDKEQLRALLLEAFGQFSIDNGALTEIEGRYTVAEVISEEEGAQPRIVAVSGIRPMNKSSYCGYEITWTCTTKAYRKKGLIVDILKQCESVLPDDHIPLYCDCWRIRDNATINMVSVMKHMGMHEVIRNRIRRVFPYNKDCCGCINANEGCYCCGDLYMKER